MYNRSHLKIRSQSIANKQTYNRIHVLDFKKVLKKTKRLLFLLCFLCVVQSSSAQYDFLRPVKDSIPGGYDFWVYTPTDYYYSLESTPVIIFLHGRSLCGRNLDKVKRYGPLDAIVMGRQIEALVLVPQNPGGAWDPDKICEVLDWTKEHYAFDSTRVYVIGMSLGGYGTLDFAATYPDRVAAAMALCGGCSLSDVRGLGKVPLWIMHGTADRAVPIKNSKVVVEQLQQGGNDKRLRYDWLKGASHGALARVFYMTKAYEWLFSHSLLDQDRPVNTEIDIEKSDLSKAYNDMISGAPDPEVVYDKTIY